MPPRVPSTTTLRLTIALGVCVLVAACQRPFDTALERGDAAAAKKQWKEAVDAYSAAVKLDPSSGFAQARLGAAAWNAGDHALAASSWATAAGLDATNSVAADGLARAALEAGDAGAALGVLEKLPTPQGPARLTLVRALLAVGGPAEVTRALELAQAAAATGDDESVYLLGSAQIAAHKYADAQSTLDGLQRRAPKSPLAPYGLARLAAAQQRQTDALLHLREAQQAAGTSWNSQAVAADPAFVFLQDSAEFKALVTLGAK
ncbi:MAG: tetratricopeptide repeat protein [Myxococcaceae bacterium]